MAAAEPLGRRGGLGANSGGACLGWRLGASRGSFARPAKRGGEIRAGLSHVQRGRPGPAAAPGRYRHKHLGWKLLTYLCRTSSMGTQHWFISLGCVVTVAVGIPVFDTFARPCSALSCHPTSSHMMSCCRLGFDVPWMYVCVCEVLMVFCLGGAPAVSRRFPGVAVVLLVSLRCLCGVEVSPSLSNCPIVQP